MFVLFMKNQKKDCQLCQFLHDGDVCAGLEYATNVFCSLHCVNLSWLFPSGIISSSLGMTLKVLLSHSIAIIWGNAYNFCMSLTFTSQIIFFTSRITFFLHLSQVVREVRGKTGSQKLFKWSVLLRWKLREVENTAKHGIPPWNREKVTIYSEIFPSCKAISIVNTPNFHDFLPCKVGGAAHTEKKLNPRKVKWLPGDDRRCYNWAH